MVKRHTSMLRSRTAGVHPLLYVSLALLLTVVFAWGFGLRSTPTVSLPMGLYVRVEPEMEPGRLLTFCPPEAGQSHHSSCSILAR